MLKGFYNNEKKNMKRKFKAKLYILFNSIGI